MDWIAHVTEALFSTYRGASKLPDEILTVEGYSSFLVRRLLNNLCDFDGCRYVEVGTWQGATALSASYLNRGSFKAIDNFSEFGGPREVCLRNRERWRGQCHFELIDADVWSYDIGSLGPANVYFYDGGHTEEDQYKAFTRFDGILTDPFIAIVDDWNWKQVRTGTRRAFAELRYDVLAMWNLYSPGNCTINGWWNGLFLAVISRTSRS
jgi:hypothetical protein